ncbi:cytochrome P450 [Trametopsis cervina]|nr:cytochrome P450 [Trametopsis cervina]
MAQSLLTAISNTTTTDATLVAIASGLAAHWVFRRWEPMEFLPVGVLLLGIPSVVSTLFVQHYGIILGNLLSFTIYYTTLLTSIALYRISPFHPLAKYPGPPLARLSGFYMASIALRGKRHLYLQSLHDKYGDFVRIGPNELNIRDSSAIGPLLGPNGMPKGPGMMGMMQHQTTPLIAFADPVEHARRRKPWNRAFSTNALRDYRPTLAKRVTQLADAMQEEGTTVDLAKWTSYFAYDFMGDMAYGGGTELLRDGDKDGQVEALKDGMRFAVMFEHVPWLSFYTRHIPALGAALKRLRSAAYERTVLRYQEGTATKDLFFFLSNEDNAEKVSPPRDIVLSDGVLAVIAGSDTTATALASIFYSLLSHPETYKKLQAEVDHYYPAGEDALDPEHYVQMTYLDAIINEAMRLFPATPSGSLRKPLSGSGGKAFGEHFIPEGTQTRITVWGVQRDPSNFSRPNEFWPDRWLIADGRKPAPAGPPIAHNVNAFLPFSVGPANCVGKNLALMEMKMVICLFMQRYEMRFADGWDANLWDEHLEDTYVMGVGHLPVTIQLRD